MGIPRAFRESRFFSYWLVADCLGKPAAIAATSVAVF
jgi:hypothetical protein